ncbi:hypothetical protein E2C01_034673 [Portunus trituberculatus]|uniref:Uncharacterized protein n=1 Tax=Portunus trituberculatus TaxID=210409 RepID=A0A5B7F255_PORTR|nr:hypothetical protein [Portunus trituberculatus]
MQQGEREGWQECEGKQGPGEGGAWREFCLEVRAGLVCGDAASCSRSLLIILLNTIFVQASVLAFRCVIIRRKAGLVTILRLDELRRNHLFQKIPAVTRIQTQDFTRIVVTRSAGQTRELLVS